MKRSPVLYRTPYFYESGFLVAFRNLPAWNLLPKQIAAFLCPGTRSIPLRWKPPLFLDVFQMKLPFAAHVITAFRSGTFPHPAAGKFLSDSLRSAVFCRLSEEVCSLAFLHAYSGLLIKNARGAGAVDPKSSVTPETPP